MKTSTAYNLESFETEESPARTPRVGVIRSDPHAQRLKSIKRLKRQCIALAAVVVVLMFATVFSHMRLNETKASIESSKDTLTELQSENKYLNFTLENHVTLGEAETYAKENLGLIKINSSQIDYINTSKDNEVTSDDDGGDSFLKYIFQKIAEAIAGN
ncbi:MAG: hypothetical protein ACOX6J_03955 [Oscillospiraceae bacterium]|jgi:hypothetical protein